MTANLTPCRPGQRPVRAASARRVDARACALARLRAGVRRGFLAVVAARFVVAHARDRFGPGVAAAFSFRATASRSRFSWLALAAAAHASCRDTRASASSKASALIAARTCVACRAAPTRVLRDLTARPTPIQLRILGARLANTIVQRDQPVLVEIDECGTLRVAQQRLLGLGEHGPYGVVHGVPWMAAKRSAAYWHRCRRRKP